MSRATLSSVLVRIGEMVLAIALVLVFFASFMGILSLSFPRGTGFGELLSYDDRLTLERGSLNLDLNGIPADTQQFVATLSDVSRRVKDRRSGAISWENARSGLALGERHAIQTFDRSGASISFNQDNRLDLGENSLVVIRRLEQTRDQREKRASLVMLGGELRGRIAGDGHESMRLDIVTPGAKAHIASRVGQDTDFKLVTGKDDSTTLAVYAGVAEITAGGRRIVIEENQLLRVEADGRAGAPVSLPGVPQVHGPEDAARYAYRDAPPPVRLTWEAEARSTTYRIELSRDPEFTDLLYAGELAEPWFEHGNLSEGRYHWRVVGSAGGIEGSPSASRTFEMIRDHEPPALRVDFPDEVLAWPTHTLRGSTEPGATVFVADREFSVGDSGDFEISLDLQPGPNIVVVEAYDDVGNVAYVSQMIRVDHPRTP